MQKFTPREKMSKRNRNLLDKKKRTTWDFAPVSRVVPSAKLYNRSKNKYFNTDYN